MKSWGHTQHVGRVNLTTWGTCCAFEGGQGMVALAQE